MVPNESKLIVDSMRNEIQSFQHKQNRLEKNSCCLDVEKNSTSAANILVQKFIEILENGKAKESEPELELKPEPQPGFSASQVEKQGTETERRKRISFVEHFDGPSEKSPEEKAVSNSVVMRKVLSFMSAPSLLEFRQVSGLWKEEATSILLSPRHAEFFCVKFEWQDHRREFLNETTLVSLSDFMENFMKPLKLNSKSNLNSTLNTQIGIFPCSQFLFSGGQLSDPTLMQFFSEFGSQVLHLGLFPETLEPPEMAPLTNILFKWTPNLKSFSFKQNQLENVEKEEAASLNDDDEFFKLPSFLPNLRKLIILPKTKSKSTSNEPRVEPQSQSDLLQKLLTSSPNLTSIEDAELDFISEIVSAGKLSLVESLRFNISRDDFDAGLSRLVNARLELKSLNLEVTDYFFITPRKRAAICGLLQSVQNTLEKVTGLHKIGGPSNLVKEFPELPKVTHLTLNCRTLSAGLDILPPGNALALALPNLKSMELELNFKLGDKNVFRFISPLNAHAGLQKLKISPSNLSYTFQFLFEWMKPLENLYPNLTHLHFALHKMGANNVPNGLKVISRHFQNLEQLFMEFQIDENTPLPFKREMDMALTGLPLDICERLWAVQGAEEGAAAEFLDSEGLNKIRTSPSIFDLKKLTKLTFEVLYFDQDPNPLWTQVAELHAFEPMTKRQGFEVNVRGSQFKCALVTGGELRPSRY